jgi:chromosome segregation ATPase
VPGFRRRDRVESSVEDEREALRRQRAAGAEELERLKQELADRVAAVRRKERQLDEALEGAPSAPASTDRERELAEREAALADRERALTAQAALPPAGEARTDDLARVEARLAELRDAERAFLRTQEELAARSEALAARERLVADRERDVDELEDRAGLGPTRSDLAELESRLRRLETRPAAGEDTQSFAAGLEGLRRRGTKRPSGS